MTWTYLKYVNQILQYAKNVHSSQTVLPEMFLVYSRCPVIHHAAVRDALGEIQALPAFTWCLISKFIFSGQWLEFCVCMFVHLDLGIQSSIFTHILSSLPGKGYGLDSHCEVLLIPSSSRLPVRRILKQDSNETLCSEQLLIRTEEG